MPFTSTNRKLAQGYNATKSFLSRPGVVIALASSASAGALALTAIGR